MIDDWVAQEAARLVENLFTMGGTNERADRLVLRQDGPTRDLGGWCRAAVRDRIESCLRAGYQRGLRDAARLARALAGEEPKP